MKYTTLGRSGLHVSKISLGGNSWGAAGRRAWGAFGPAESRAFFKRALDVGFNFFDTADAYNEGVSEEIMGNELLPLVRRDDLVITTKVGLKMGPGPNDTGVGRKHLMAGVDASLRRLKTDYIDLYLIHRLDGVTPLEETMEALNDMVRAGKVRYVGGSTMPAYKFAQMLAIADHKHWARPIAMQNLYNLIQREEELEMNALCAEQGVAVTPYSPLARGFLAANRVKEGDGATERAKKDAQVKAGSYRPCDHEIAARVRKIAAARGLQPTQVALAWMLSKPALPVIGSTQLHYLDEAAKATETSLTADEIKSLEEPYVFRPVTG